ncbi:hypothetical protein ABK040_003278 [Willaertia magna]
MSEEEIYINPSIIPFSSLLISKGEDRGSDENESDKDDENWEKEYQLLQCVKFKPKIKLICSPSFDANNFICFITEIGEVYLKGELEKYNYKEFTKIENISNIIFAGCGEGYVMLIDHENNLFGCGVDYGQSGLNKYNTEHLNDIKEFTRFNVQIKDKIKFIHCGPDTIIIVTMDNKILFVGNSEVLNGKKEHIYEFKYFENNLPEIKDLQLYLIEPKQCRGNFHHYYRHYQQNNNDNSNINNNDNNSNNALENVKTIKRFQLFNEKQQFNDFLNELKKHFEDFSFEKYKLKYKDNENDWIEISNENDWKVALELFYNNQQTEPIRIQLIQTTHNHSHHHHFGHQQHPCHGFRFGNNGSCFGGRRGPFGCHNFGGLFNFEKLFENLNTNNSGSNNNCNNLFENIANIVDTLFKDINNDSTNNNEQQEKKENNNNKDNTNNNKNEEEIVVDEFLYGDEDKQNNIKEEESKQQKEEENKATTNVDNSKKYKLTLPPHIQLPPFIEPLLSQFNQLPKEKQENLLTLARNFFPLIDQFITEDNTNEKDEIKDDNINYPSINNEEQQQVPFFNPFNASNGFGNNNGGLPAMFQNFMNNFQQSNDNSNNTQLRDFTQELEQLENMGFGNREYNLNLLQKYNGNLELVLNNLLSENQF